MSEVPAIANASRLHIKVSSLFNNPLYSDVEFTFGHGQKIYCHKLILSLRSKIFSRMFYEGKDSLKNITLPASIRPSFYLLLKFLYTDDVKFNTFEEAEDLLLLSDEYAVDELVNKCRAFLSENIRNLNHLFPRYESAILNNLFPRYESALKKNITVVLEDCRNFVCSNIQQIFKSESFINASPDVVEDIIKQDNLSVSTELEVIEAVLNWGSASLKRNHLSADEKQLRHCVGRFLRYLRILSLTPEEFEYLVGRYNVFSSHESMLLTRKLLQPESYVKLPRVVCSTTAKRNAVQFDVKTSVYSNRNQPSASNVSKLAMTESNENLTGNKISYEVKQCGSDSSESSSSKIGKITYEVKKGVLKNPKACPAHYKRTKFKSSSSIENKTSSTEMASQTQMKHFLFDLMENETSFKSSFKSDITSSISFRMKKGSLSLIGFELKVKNKNTAPEILEVDVELEGFSNDIFRQKYSKELSNNVFTVKLSKPMILKEGYRGRLEVSVDDLSLNRCYVCSNDSLFELCHDHNFACEVSISSNKKLILLISKLMYVAIRNFTV